MRLPGLSRFQYLFQNRALVLMYHRINTLPADPWNLAVSQENFEEHLNILKDKCKIISTDELVQQIKSGKIQNRSVAITFDDGYLDNYVKAKPLLEKYTVPATFFITDSYLGGDQPFWWDELEYILIHTNNLPPGFNVQFKGETIIFDLGSESELNDEIRALHKNYNAFNPPTFRSKFYLMLWEKFCPLRKTDQMELLGIIRQWAGLTETETRVEGAMTALQLKEMSDAEHDLFTIAGHTSTHPSLPDQDEDYQAKEIIDNRNYLETLLEKNINLFAYPSGNYNDSTIKIVKDTHYKAAFATKQKIVNKKSDLYEITRCQVNNISGDMFSEKIKKWLG